ncbi:SAE2-domain-containing protein [Ophiobolus disseminans]|uniref:SAE2-domain-containing protein n=1 Tax=Ophiobolus disseminans TaxID=1469910 RepID=A0A6A6ZZG1_9PLEO|nr:SAE2-domain-containing protein [Ophiobolus disseminans]
MADFTAWSEKNKALWTRVYDEVIAPEMEDEWRKRDEAHERELKQKEENRQILHKRMEEEMVKNSHLVSENDQLKSKLERSPITRVLEDIPDHEEEAAEDHADLADKYNELRKKFQDLEQQVKYLKRKNNTVMQKNKDMKESVRAWQEYADRQSGKQRPKNESKTEDDQPRLSAVPQIEDTRPHMPSSPRSVATFRTPLFPANQGRSSPAPIVALAQPETEWGDAQPFKGFHSEFGPGNEARSGSLTPKPTDLVRSSEEQRLGINGSPLLEVTSNTTTNGYAGRQLHSYLQTNNPSSSQTTVEEADPFTGHTQSAIVADDNDMPQFVSARSVNKRKRALSSKIEVHGDRSDGTPIKPYRVKEEPGSSPPNIHSLLRKDTIDLDAPGSGLLRTPRHPRHQRSSSAPFSQRVKPENEYIAPAVLEESGAASADIRALSEPSDSTDNANDILRHLDPNTVAEPRENLSNKRIKLGDAWDQNAHRMFSESGEEPPPTDEDELRLPPSAARAKLNRRLHGSPGSPLASTSVHKRSMPGFAKTKVEQSRTPPQSSTRSTNTPLLGSRLREPPNPPLFTAPTIPATDDRPQWKMKAPETGPVTRKTLASLSKKQDRLRLRPVEELKPQDFKVNPAYNQGYTYAFSETVRKRGDRACLPGCTNLQCCGSTFRSFAEVQAPLPLSQEEALLEDYLGEAYDNTSLTQMASEERQELVLQARTAKMAKESGKHREAYERRRTPPGFWRVDFASTQEEQQDREKGRELQKDLVRERRREALRKGGKWIFRDE